MSAPAAQTHTKVTRNDWLRAAKQVLIQDGVAEVKIQTLGAQLGVSRSSFYWYFKSREDLLAQLLHDWEASNTGILLQSAGQPSPTISEAVYTLFRCVLHPEGFNHPLDFAVREWARRDAKLRDVIDRSDAARQQAVAAMFVRHGYAPEDADLRARVLYYQQIGYHALELSEPLEDRIARAAGYVYCFTGVHPKPEETARFVADVRRMLGSENGA